MRPRFILLTALLALVLVAQYDPKLQYQDRGDRHEGLRPLPVSGYDVALVSARVDAPAPDTGWPDEMRLGFYLPEKKDVHVTVRQLRSKSAYYWLDEVTSTWRAAAWNEFAWPTAPVLRQLPRLKVEHLGTVVRLGRSEPGNRETVAPAVLYASRPPSVVEGYRFKLKVNGAAHVTCRVYRGDEKIFERPENAEKPGLITVRWRTGGAPDGWYRLVASGYFDHDNTALDQEVRFFHKEKP